MAVFDTIGRSNFMVPDQINLEDMQERHRALTLYIAGGYKEAAAVCMSRHHTSPIEITLVDNEIESLAELHWNPPDGRTTDAWANVIDTTEAGAYGCVIASIELRRRLFAVRRAETGTGADYYIGPAGSGEEDLEGCFRLEVSGVSNGDQKAVAKRLLQKVRQAQQGVSSLPAVAGVIGFSASLIMVKDVSEGP